MSDEQLLYYLEAAEAREQREFSNRIEAARLGYVFARNQKAHARWRREQDRLNDKPAPMNEAALMHALSRVAGMFPENVIYGG